MRRLRLLERGRKLRDLFRFGWRDGGAPGPDGLPLPPRRLIQRVAGTEDPGWFMRSGALAADDIRRTLSARAVPLESVSALLDFGCGCGRVARHWAGLSGCQVHGCDRDAGAVRWCRAHLPFGRFVRNRLQPPLPYDRAQFGLVYALSVFTHLPDALQRRWMEELHRVLAPGGHLLLTTHGASYLGELDAAERERFLAGELVVRQADEPGSNACGAYHPLPYLHQLAGERFRLLHIEPEGARGNPHQDLVLLRRE